MASTVASAGELKAKANAASLDMAEEFSLLRREMDAMHDSRESGCCPINSRGAKDIYGRTFSLPVDAEHKATALNLFSFAKPHMRAFHTSWVNYFASFVSTFAAAPLTAYMRKSSSLNLSKADLSAGKIASVTGTVMLRLVMGYVMDMFGARKGTFVLMAICTPGIIGMMFTTNAAGYIACRQPVDSLPSWECHRESRHCPSLLGLRPDAPGCATHSGEVPQPLRSQCGAAWRCRQPMRKPPILRLATRT